VGFCGIMCEVGREVEVGVDVELEGAVEVKKRDNAMW